VLLLAVLDLLLADVPQTPHRRACVSTLHAPPGKASPALLALQGKDRASVGRSIKLLSGLLHTSWA
jgi:hypothetical protein